MKTLALASLFLIGISINLSCDRSKSKAQSYYHLKGTISNIPITMQMHVYGHVISGVYWYDTKGKPINFSGDDTTLPGSIILKNYLNDAEETMILNKVGSDFMGSWSSNKKTGLLKVKLSESKNKIDFEYYSTDSIYEFKINNDQVTYSYSASMIWPTATDKFSKMLAKEIKSELTNDSLNNDKPDVFLINRQQEFLTEYKNLFDSLNTDLDYAFSMASHRNIELLYQNDYYLCTHIQFYDDGGGAHGYGGDIYKTYDIEHCRQVKLTDIFTASGLTMLPRLIEKQIKIDRGVRLSEPISSAGLFDQGVEEVTENFYLTPLGIGFVYNQYEIAPYASGPYDVFLYYNKLAAYLQPGFKK